MLWFVTPAHGRFGITRWALEQRAKLCKRIGAQCVVVADDANHDLALELGLHAVKIENRFLGRKFNAGVTYALEQGASHITLFDSDSISLDSVYETLPTVPTFHPNYSFVLSNGRRAEVRHERWVQTIWPAEWMELVEGKPCNPWINRNVSSSALHNITMAAEGYGKELAPETVQFNKLEQVGFQSEENISNALAILYSSRTGNWASDVWEPLYETYKEDHSQILGLELHYERNHLA